MWVRVTGTKLRPDPQYWVDLGLPYVQLILGPSHLCPNFWVRLGPFVGLVAFGRWLNFQDRAVASRKQMKVPDKAGDRSIGCGVLKIGSPQNGWHALNGNKDQESCGFPIWWWFYPVDGEGVGPLAVDDGFVRFDGTSKTG